MSFSGDLRNTWIPTDVGRLPHLESILHGVVDRNSRSASFRKAKGKHWEVMKSPTHHLAAFSASWHGALPCPALHSHDAGFHTLAIPCADLAAVSVGKNLQVKGDWHNSHDICILSEHLAPTMLKPRCFVKPVKHVGAVKMKMVLCGLLTKVGHTHSTKGGDLPSLPCPLWEPHILTGALSSSHARSLAALPFQLCPLWVSAGCTPLSKG